MAKKPDPETPIRRERFAAYCKRRGWFDSATDRWKSADIAKAINRKPNQIYNLFNERYAFGPTVARDLEDELGLPRYYFDGAAAWPFSRELQRAVESLDVREIAFAENALRAHLRLSPVEIPASGESTPQMVANG